jgi:hypothetical protein
MHNVRRLLSQVFQPWSVTLMVGLVYLLVILFLHGGNPLTWIVLPEPPSEANPSGTTGYDGQFTYAIALNVADSPPLLDVPAYRLQRILLPVLAGLLSFGQPALVPWAIALINLASLAAGVWCLQTLLRDEKISPWFSLVYGLFPGVLMAARLSLNEPLAYGLVLAAVLSERRGRAWWSAMLLALASLAKETTLAFVLGYMLWMALHRRWRDLIRLGGAAWGVFLAWQAILYLWLGQIGIGSGGRFGTPFELVPYGGLWRIYWDTGSLRILLVFAAVLIPTAVFPSIWGIVHGIRDLVRRSWHPYSALLLANAAVIMITPYSTFRELFAMQRFMAGLVISVLLYSAHTRRLRMLLYSVIWLTTLVMVISGG